ncbi:Uncharacterised protein [Segatella copri]|nr:Uncharacterised protein [Segatella copri]
MSIDHVFYRVGNFNFLLDDLTDFMKMGHTCSDPECSGTCHSSAFSADATS